MKHWLLKTEPGTYSWADLCRDGKTCWDGVRNFQARNNLRAMRPGDLALFYHSGGDRNIVGVARVTSEPYRDASATKGDWSMVDVEPAYAVGEAVSLERIKDEPRLSRMVLVRQSRLSVQPVTKAEFDRIVRLGGKVAC